jgi:hypothetical protein
VHLMRAYPSTLQPLPVIAILSSRIFCYAPTHLHYRPFRGSRFTAEWFVCTVAYIYPDGRQFPRDGRYILKTAVGDAAAGGADEARRLMSSHPYNIVIINTPLPDDFGLRLAVDLIRYESTAVPFIR